MGRQEKLQGGFRLLLGVDGSVQHLVGLSLFETHLLLRYALSPDMYQLFAARFVVGIAAANYAPAGAYLSYATTSADRAKIMAWNSAATVLGFICGPAFAMITALPALQWSTKIGDYT